MKRRTILGSVVAAGAVLAFAACGGGGGSSVTAPTPGPTCLPATLNAALVYPAPGATAVPDNLAQIVVAVSTPLPNFTYNLALAGPTINTQTYYTLAQIGASQLPPGSHAPTFANPTYEQVQLISSFPPGTQVTAIGINDPSSTCTPLTIPGATFTTQ